ncbi:hypothetical protein HCN44_005742 [Aphidius gifuensis]|uniref:Heme oxygenase n=1 Tax=Aphidius gifuensis TaxID=684658 RepID=A0A834XVM0_APHGI|nr:heme oxygenase [Aphidius gifuensis]KAF7992961.1 hypothetical protein HCN44_005742 [Aphidius gifuensis]
MSEAKVQTFCDKMRIATREVHNISNDLVVAKLAFGFHNDKVWADGVLAFYDIFLQLEKSMVTVRNNCGIDNLITPDIARTKAFENDLNYYLGNDWIKNHSPRPSVVKYLSHLKELEQTNPILLIAYVYHLYLGLMSGGVILKKKRQFMKKLLPFKNNDSNEGNNISDFGFNEIGILKKQFRDKMNEIADGLSEETRQQLIDESKVMYSLNDEVIRSIKGANAVVAKTIIYTATIAVVVGILFYIYKR